jgi:hypothetical protein
MQKELPIGEDAILASVRCRGRRYLGYLFWAVAVMAGLWAMNAAAALLGRWISILQQLRRSAGLPVPAAGPDYWILGGVAMLVFPGIAVLTGAYTVYRITWNRRLRNLWRAPELRRFSCIPQLRDRANAAELQRRADYLKALASSREWKGLALDECQDKRQWYTNSAAAILRAIEPDVGRRAVTAGLVVGVNRNPLFDILTIAASGFELQLYVLTRLGKRPSLGTWIQMAKHVGASLFLNSYVSREDALCLNLAIRKAALGIEVAGDSLQAMADLDWDEVLGDVHVPGLSAVTSLASMGIGVGAFGLRHLGNFIETTANDLLQGVLAGGILYYHGMGLAAHCLALDQEHCATPEMTRTVEQAMVAACTPAGQLLRDQLRHMRGFLRERRRAGLGVAKDAARHGIEKLSTASSSAWANLKEATGVLSGKRAMDRNNT